MKKIFRITALLLAVIMLTMTLCSCNYLDSLRAHQLFYTDDTKREIEFEDSVYKILNPGRLTFIFTDLYDIDASYFVTKKDVPVLVSHQEGDYVSINNEKTIMNMWGLEDKPTWYVREDCYEKAKAALETAKLDHYFLGYLDYPEDDDLLSPIRQENILLDDDMTAVIDRALATPANERVEYKKLGKGDYDQAIIHLSICDKDMIVTDDGKSIFLIRDDGSNGAYYVWDGNEYDEYSLCPVKEDDIETVKAFYRAYPHAAESYNIRYHWEDNYYNRGYEDEVIYPERTYYL